jgi:hypothetical protein
MIKLEINKMAKAIERAKTVRPRVKVINADARIFAVTGSKGDVYTVRFAVANGHKLAECDCKAGQTGMMCFHVAAAASVNIAVQSMRRQATAAPAVPVLPAKDADKVSTVQKTHADRYGRRSGNAMIVDGWAI